MTPHWTRAEVLAATGGSPLGGGWNALGLSIDTRTLAPGDLFIALSAARDGHDFVADALAKGAAAALISKPDCAPAGPAVVVPDVQQALEALGRFARDRSSARRIGVTGSVGKTSTKDAIAHILTACGPTHAAVKSFNNHWGVPLTLARMPQASRFGVFEMGMNHRHEIAPLTAQVRPHVAIVTWIAPAHLEALGSLEEIAREKGDVYSGLEPGGAALVPADAPHADILLEAAARAGARIVRFGRGEGLEARLLRFAAVGETAEVEAELFGRRIAYRMGVSAAHWALNGLAALAAAHLAGGDLERCAAAFATLSPSEGRGVIKTPPLGEGAFTLIDDSYNANPASMEAAFATLAARPVAAGARRIAVIGSMLELGPESAAFHAGLVEPLLRCGIDLVFCGGVETAPLWGALPPSVRGGYAEDAESLTPAILAHVGPGDVVLVKGSHGSRMHRVAAALAAGRPSEGYA